VERRLTPGPAAPVPYGYVAGHGGTAVTLLHEKRMVRGVATVNSRYRHANGRVAQNWPYPLIDLRRRTEQVDIADHEAV